MPRIILDNVLNLNTMLNEETDANFQDEGRRWISDERKLTLPIPMVGLGGISFFVTNPSGELSNPF